MRYREIITESMSVTPYRHDGEKREPVFPPEWDEQWLFKHPAHLGIDEEPEKNPHYRPDLNLNLANGNAIEMMEIMGYPPNEGYTVPIDEFIGRATQWLRRHVGKQVGGTDTHEEPREISGKNIDYRFGREQVYKREYESLIADPKIRKGASKMNAVTSGRVTLDDWIKRIAAGRAQTAADEWEAAQRAANEKPIGPRIIHVGRRDGYMNDVISRAVRIAQEGKKRGATHLTVA